jgi:hypothetical protein
MSDATIIKRTYMLESTESWDDQLEGFVRRFETELEQTPNILLAHSSTFALMDAAATAREENRLLDHTGRPPKPSDFPAIGGFVGDGYELEFGVDPTLPDGTLTLIFDSAPEIVGAEPDSAMQTAEGSRRTG